MIAVSGAFRPAVSPRRRFAARREEAVALIPFAAPGVPGLIVAVGRATERRIGRQHPALP